MTSFINKHLALILSALLSIAGWVWTAATAFTKADDAAKHLEAINRDGTEMARRCEWRISAAEKDLLKLDARLNSALADIIQIKSDMRVVAEWVEEQKRKTRYENSAVSKKEFHQQAD